MKHDFLASLVATSLATSPPALADAEAIAGTPVSVGTLVAQAEMIRIADALDAAVDAKEWAIARSFFSDTIDVDFTSLAGGEPARIVADALVAGWAANLTEEKTSFHLRGNHRVTFEANGSATMQSHGYAWNRLERGALPDNGNDALWEVWGTYAHRFVKTEDGWKVNAMTFTATAQRGNPFVRDTPGS
ncbi:MAG: nuclear transport factor 2 family protein [Pseudomonadota bacterium]